MSSDIRFFLRDAEDAIKKIQRIAGRVSFDEFCSDETVNGAIF